MNMSIAIKYLLLDLKSAHENLEKTMEGVTDEVAAFTPPGIANPIAGIYAHLVFTEDFFIQSFLKKTSPLFEGEWKDKTGISEKQPTDWVTEYPVWLKTVKVDVESAKIYAKATFSVSEEYISTLSDSDLDKDVDMSMFGMGAKPAGEFISGMVIGHIWSIMGEISVLKGIQGLKGYPF